MIKLNVHGCLTLGDNRIISLKSGKNIFITDYIVSKVHNTNLGNLRNKSDKSFKDLKEGKDYIVLEKDDIKKNKTILRPCGLSNISLDRTNKMYLYGVKAYKEILEKITTHSSKQYVNDILSGIFGEKVETDVVEKIELPCEITIEGEFNLGDKIISIVKGGFGPDQKILSEMQIAELHNKELKHVRDAIGRMKSKLIQWVDYIDLNDCLHVGNYLDMFGYTKQQRTAKHFYILSERGYFKLAKHFNDDESWDVFESLLNEYFKKPSSNEAVIKNEDEDRAHALLLAIEGKTLAERAAGMQKYTELLTSDMQKTIDAQNLLIDTIVSDDSLYAVSLVGRVLKSYNPKMFGKVKIFEMLRANGILISSRNKEEHNTPHYSYSKYFEVKFREVTLDNGDKKVVPKTFFNSKGLEWFLKKISKEGLIDKDKVAEIKVKVSSNEDDIAA